MPLAIRSTLVSELRAQGELGEATLFEVCQGCPSCEACDRYTLAFGENHQISQFAMGLFYIRNSTAKASLSRWPVFAQCVAMSLCAQVDVSHRHPTS